MRKPQSRRRGMAVLMLLALCLLLAACGRGTQPAASLDETSSSEDISASAASQENDKKETQSMAEQNKDGKILVEITMENGGVIKLALDPASAPKTVENFVNLVEDGFYDGLTFHRIVDDFMIQGGCPTGTGTGGPGHTIEGEFASNGWSENNISHQPGVISMARSGHPDSAGSQFFICVGDASFLDGDYAAFGEVIEGMDVLEALAKTPTDWDAMGREKSVPLEPVVIKTIRVVSE